MGEVGVGAERGVSSSADRAAMLRAAFLWACGLDVAVRKPGNVSHASAGHAMQAGMFLDSARAAAGPLFAPGARVGERIEGAVAATRAAVGCNTNLGILLLCAPLAAAIESLPAAFETLPAAFESRLDGADRGRPEAGSAVRGATRSAATREPVAALAALRLALLRVLSELDRADAAAAYRGIALANPGGLGEAAEQDVAAPPSVDLRAAMGLAAERDSIARQYANAYADIFACGFSTLREAVPEGRLSDAVQRVFLGYLAGWPDSHIVRKLGASAAQSVTADAAAWQTRLRSDPAAADSAEFAAWDESLKALAINPGTSADLTVCTLFAAALVQPELPLLAPAERWHGSCIPAFGIGLFPTPDMMASRPGRSR